MTGFVDRLVARGAGLPLPERAATLRLRPVSSFEAGPAESLSTGLTAPVSDDGLQVTSNPATPERYEQSTARHVAATAPSPPSGFEARQPVGEETALPPRIQQTERRSHSLDVPASRHSVTREQATAAEYRPTLAVETSLPVKSNAGDNPKVVTRPVAEETTFVEAAAHRQRDSIAEAIPPAAEIAPEASTPAWGERPSFATTQTQPPVPTISVNRIDVQFLPPPAAPAAPSSAPRSRGFDAYARARRGIPR